MYLQLMEQIRRRIAVGDWGPGQEIPSIRALAASTRVSVITIKRAYQELERDGVIVTRQGRGTFVSENVAPGRDLRARELDERLAAVARLGAEIGLDPVELADRMREIAEAEEEKRR
jgi:GntR family transcriptional regulator